MKSISEIANRLSLLCTEHKFVEAYKELFSELAESIDPLYKNETLKGLTNLIEREENFLASAKIQRVKMSEPIFAGNYFSLVLSMEFTSIDRGHRKVEEICVYKVENGEIISQQFFIG